MVNAPTRLASTSQPLLIVMGRRNQRIATCRQWLICALILGTVLGAVLAPVRVWGEDRVVISEFLAANTRGITDRDRERSDWIELYNAGASEANLDGWFLTDDRSNLKKWRFPAVTLGAGEYLVVFASKKNRRQPGAELHTNFKLDATSGYLALVKPDGTSIATEFAPSYPRQIANVSYGYDLAERGVALVGPNAAERWLVPTRDAGPGWTGPEFDDGRWNQATNGLGFDSPGVGGELRSQMLGKSTSALLRIPFQVRGTNFESLRLRLSYSDGFVAYLNGHEVARRHAPEKVQWNSSAASGRNVPAAVTLEETFEESSTNYVTAQLDPSTRPRPIRGTGADADGHLRLINGRLTNQVASMTFAELAKGPFESYQADFDFRWRGSGEGTERLLFLLIPTSAYGPMGNGVDLTAIREMKDPKFGGVLAVQLLYSPHDGQKALTVHWDRTRQITVPLPGGAFAPRLFHHAQVRLRFHEAGASLDVELGENRNGQRVSHPTVSQLALPGLRPFPARAQFAARIGNWDQTIDLDNVRLESVPLGQGSAEEFDLAEQAKWVRSGANVLAIHGLSQKPDDSTFYLRAELSGAQGTNQGRHGRYFGQPTPRAANRDGSTEVAPSPVFSHRGGVFTNQVTLELSAPAGQVHYTLDGSEPNAGSPAYNQPIPLNQTTLVRAKTFMAGLLPSGTMTESFTLLDDSVANFTSNLPLLIINPFGQYLSANSKSMVSVRVIDTVKGRSSLAGPADFDGRASANIRGFSTLRQPKNSLTIRLKDENEDKIKSPLLGMPKESDWVLYAPYSDKTLIRDALAYELSNKMGRYAPRTRFVEVYIDRSGGRLGSRDYMGVYVLVEKIKKSKNRVNIADLDGAATAEPEISGGYIFKRDHSERWEQSFHTSHGNHFYFVDPKPAELTREQMSWLQRYMNRFEQALYGPEFRDSKRGYAAYLDVDSFIDQHWLIEMSKNIDGFRYSAFITKDRGGKLQMGPAWDWNLSFGNADYHDGSDPTGWYTHLLRESEICWFRRLSEDPDFEQRVVDRWGELRRTVFAPASLHKRVDEMAAQLQEAQARNFNRWRILGRRVNPNDFVGSTYAEEIQWMKQWMQKRINWIDNQFVAAPIVNRNGSSRANDSVTLRASSGKILYTLDGTDPRGPGGVVSPQAQIYSAPIALKTGAKLFARTQGRNGWSCPTTLTVSPSDRAGN
jgi:hypothetical protein